MSFQNFPLMLFLMNKAYPKGILVIKILLLQRQSTKLLQLSNHIGFLLFLKTIQSTQH